jgi:deoxyribodipyrimidine photo-lyase
MPRPLVWFRRDLRVDDHAALLAAAARADDGLVALFVLSPGEWRAHDDAPAKVDFWLRNLARLSDALHALHVPLIIEAAGSAAEVPAVVRDVARRCGCTELHANREYEVDESRRDAAVRAALGAPMHLHDDRPLLPPGSVRTLSGEAYTVFTPFKRRWLAALSEATPTPRPAPAPQRPIAGVARSPVPAAVPGFASTIDPALWPAGEDAAAARLRSFVDHTIAGYRSARDLPATRGTSGLSPYLAAGVLSPRRCLAAATAANGGLASGGLEGPDTWISELCWRDFYLHVMVAFPRVSMGRAFRREADAVRWRDAPDELARWREGTTGFPLVDAAMRQLRATGWMHNRLRMLTAMFLTKDLLIDWREGERLFMQHLVDGDLAANNGGWQWSSSTGTDAQPYFRVFNPYAQAARFDPDGEFVRRWVPELRDLDAATLRAADRLGSLERRRLGYPEPMVDHAAARARALAAFRGLAP